MAGEQSLYERLGGLYAIAGMDIQIACGRAAATIFPSGWANSLDCTAFRRKKNLS
jgi:hypothetical protein